MARTSKFSSKDRLEMATLKARGMTDKAIGIKFGVSHTTVKNQMTELEREVAKSAPFVREHIRNLAVILSEKLRLVLDQINEEKTANANILQLANAASIINSILRLEMNQVVSSNEVKYSHIDN